MRSRFPYKKRGRRPASSTPAGPRVTRAYGTTWWGKQWLQSLNQIDNANRLPRGKTYANKGMAHDLVREGNTITAKVSGSRPQPYKVSITVPPFTADEQLRLLQLINDHPLFLSRLLNHELPPDLNDACLAANIHIFPRRWTDLRGSCSCPDHAVPCKHMAAVLYLIANEIDKNPFIVFNLHNFDLQQSLLADEQPGAAAELLAVPSLASLQQPRLPGAALPPLDEQLLAALDFSLLPDCSGELLSLLSDKPVFFPEGDFKKILTAAYRQAAAPMPLTVDLPDDPDRLAAATERLALQLSAADGSFEACTLYDGRAQPIHRFDNFAALLVFLHSISPPLLVSAADSLRALQLAQQLAERLVVKGAYVPQLLAGGDGPASYFIRLVPALLKPEVQALLAQAAPLLRCCPLQYGPGGQPADDDHGPALLSLFLGYYWQRNDKLRRQAPLSDWFFGGRPMPFEDFSLREHPKSLQLWLSRFFLSQQRLLPVFEVSEVGDCFEVGIVVEDREQPLAAPLPLADLMESKALAAQRLGLLRDLSNVADFFPPLRAHIAAHGRQKLRFDGLQFVEVLFDALPAMRLLGMRVLLPKALTKLLRPAATIALRSRPQGKVAGAGLLSFASMIDFQWQIALGDRFMSRAEFLALAGSLRGIVRLADGYTYLDDKDIAGILRQLDNSRPPSGPQLLQMALAGEYQGVRIQLDEPTCQLIESLRQPAAMPLPAGLLAQLRPYQQRGYEWLCKNARLGLGSLIADDMGLGKTLQVISLLLRLQEDGLLGGDQKALIVLPTTLLTNWTKEIGRFAPSLRTHVYHGAGRSLQPLAEADVLLTTYGLLRLESRRLQALPWCIVVVDEAQNIKNMATEQAQAARRIQAPLRIAMTGTPVENRLSEYYAILEFANPGYLGSLREFTDTYSAPIEIDRNRAVAERFRRITAPFLLRRLKTDKAVISDLPDKITTNCYCTLTPRQAALYQQVVAASLQAIDSAGLSPMQRRGLVLKMLTALKQVCNHPAHYLKKTTAAAALSGKAELLLELLGQLLPTGEKTLIFTQYREMGELLQALLRNELGQEAAFLHGGLPRAARDRLVDAFQQQRSERILILSLKAGGTGLNLTAASHVIHYDLWWNPAVEAQATDRAFRIGQQRNVQVHRFITQGTLEEKIDEMLHVKKSLAELTVASGEKWIGDLSGAELRALVSLDG